MEELMIEKIENYFKGNLATAEKLEFEAQISQDAELSLKVNEYKKVFDTLSVIQKREKLKTQFNVAHNSIPKEAKIVKMKSSFKLTLRDFAVAASVLIIMTLSLFLYFNLQQKQQSKYLMLKRDLEALKNSHNKVVQHINKKNGIVKPSKYGASAFMISSEGYLITSYHLIKEANSISVENSSGLMLDADVVYSNEKLDFSVLKISDSAFTSLGLIPYGFKNEYAELGEKVYTLGFPREDMVFGEGSVSSYTGYEGDTAAYQISIPVNPGNSGGPLFDTQGNLIGIVSGRNSSAEGASFAVKSKWISEDIKEHTEEKISLPTKKSAMGSDRAGQVKKVKDFVFMVKVMN